MGLGEIFFSIIEMLTGSTDPTERIHPGPKKTEPQKPKEFEIKSEVHWTGKSTGMPYVDTELENGVIESEFAHKKKVKRNPDLSKEETEVIKNGGWPDKTYDHLDLIKAARLKILWAQKLSAQKACDRLSEEGYSLRVVQDHWAIFNHFHRIGGGGN